MKLKDLLQWSPFFSIVLKKQHHFLKLWAHKSMYWDAIGIFAQGLPYTVCSHSAMFSLAQPCFLCSSWTLSPCPSELHRPGFVSLPDFLDLQHFSGSAFMYLATPSGAGDYSQLCAQGTLLVRLRDHTEYWVHRKGSGLIPELPGSQAKFPYFPFICWNQGLKWNEYLPFVSPAKPPAILQSAFRGVIPICHHLCSSSSR